MKRKKKKKRERKKNKERKKDLNMSLRQIITTTSINVKKQV